MKHETTEEDQECKAPMCSTYVDDVIAVIQVDNNNIKYKIINYITTMNRYFTSNKLKNNKMKTKFMIFSKDKETKKMKIKIEDKTIENKKKIKLLGMDFNDKAD